MIYNHYNSVITNKIVMAAILKGEWVYPMGDGSPCLLDSFHYDHLVHIFAVL